MPDLLAEKKPLSLCVVILTKNEERDLPHCLRALRGWAAALVVDSHSTDMTTEIAGRENVAVRTNAFSSFAQQRNWALDHCIDGFSWVLFLDADEIATTEFKQAVEREIESASEDVAGYYCCWKMMLGQRWLKRCDAFPKWQFRLVRVGRSRFADFGHGQKEGDVSGTLGYICEPYLHYAFSKGWSAWLERHNRYSSQEAEERLNAPIQWRFLFQRHGSQRNKALKPLVSRLPLWPIMRFLIDYIGRLGILEGREGFIYCVNMAYYEFLIQIKMQELARSRDINTSSAA